LEFGSEEQASASAQTIGNRRSEDMPDQHWPRHVVIVGEHQRSSKVQSRLRLGSALDGDLADLRLGALGQVDLQLAALELGLDLVEVDVVTEREAATVLEGV